MGKIIDTNDVNYTKQRERLSPSARHNGLYYYAKTLEEHVAPYLKTDRMINLIGLPGCGGEDRMIVFIHSNLDPSKTYLWLKQYQDIICVCGVRSTYEIMKQYGECIYMTPCVNIKSVKEFGKGIKKDQDSCFAGNPWPAYRDEIDRYVPAWVHRFGTMPREELLPILAHYKNVYAIGCTAVEARALGCNILKRSDKYDPEDFPLLDTKDAVKILQKEIDKIEEKNKNRCAW